MKRTYWKPLMILAGMIVIAAVESQLFAQQTGDVDVLTPYDLQVEYMTEPLGIDETFPRFSWKLKSGVQEEEQTSYRIVVYPAPKKYSDGRVGGVLPPVWDTKTVKSDNSVNIPYEGANLQPETKYNWLLIVTGKDGVESEAVQSFFTTGLFPTTENSNAWEDAVWIGYDETPEQKTTPDLSQAVWLWSEKPNDRVGIATFRKTFDLPEDEIAKATAAFTGDNSYRVYINGQKIGEGTNFKNAPVVNIAGRLKSGKNTIAVEVKNEGPNPNPAGMIGAIRVKFKKNNELNIVSDGTWKASPEMPDNWNRGDFDDSKWKNAEVVGKFGDASWGKIETGEGHPDIPARYLKYHVQPKANNVVRATAYISGLGYYEFSIDGKKIGDHVLDPILKDYNVSAPYVTYEIAPERVNRPFDLGVILGNGRYYAPRGNSFHGMVTYGFPKLLFKMVLEYGDGSKQAIVSNEDWDLTTEGPIRGNNDFDGEIYDARYEKNLTDPKVWQKAKKMDAPKGRLTAQNIPPMRVTEEIQPKSMKEVSPGVWVFDLGQNMVGWCRLKVKGQAGTEILLRHAETTLDDGNLSMANLRSAKCRDIYTLKGDPNGEFYIPRFSYHGFRFVEITGYPGKPSLDSIVGQVVHTDLPFTGRFESSNETINKIHKNIFWGVRGNYLSIPTDCPQRDERQGWQGDRAAESLGEMFQFDNVTLYSKWLQDIEDSQLPNGNLSDVCPAYYRFYNRNVTWPSAFIIVPESILKQYGDDRPIRRHYDAMVKWLKFLEADIRDGIIEADNYDDWCVPPERKELIHSQDPSRKTAKGILATSYYIHDLNLVAKYAKILGKEDDAKAFSAKAAAMTEAFNKKFYNANTGKYDNGTQTSCVLPLYFDLVPADERDKVFGTLINNIERTTNYHIGTGLIGGQWLNRVLSSFGRADISYRFATNKDYPSWGYMVEKGATTIWELWNGDTANPAMNSGNHVMLIGDLTIWFYQNLAGIKSEDGFRTIEMTPIPVGDLTFVNAEYDSVRGTIKSQWRKTGDSFFWEVKIPIGSKAFLTVPTNNMLKTTVNNKPAKINANGKIELGSGTYRVVTSGPVGDPAGLGNIRP
ncbi:MAG: glycoside hydrolase family 78 protein [Planctomycetaceae bacterium]|jgi:alpha-L-rhamnosidase|nr:glycoside hydrolase family 78 protein [Planctomycetaceae bacterium]